MSFLITNIAGSLTAGQVGQQQNTAAEQDSAEAYQTQMTREMRSRTQRMEEEVAAPEQDTDKRVGQAPDRRGQRRRGTPHEHGGSPPPIEPTEDIVDLHEPIERSPASNESEPDEPASRIDITV